KLVGHEVQLDAQVRAPVQIAVKLAVIADHDDRLVINVEFAGTFVLDVVHGAQIVPFAHHCSCLFIKHCSFTESLAAHRQQIAGGQPGAESRDQPGTGGSGQATGGGEIVAVGNGVQKGPGE